MGRKRPLAAPGLCPYKHPMNIRTRKAIGTVGTVLWLTIYALIAMAIGGQYVVGHGLALELLFYVLAGLAWIPVVMLLIRWMSRPDL
jgi:membrane protein DedA with SNARE-associated domain